MMGKRSQIGRREFLAVAGVAAAAGLAGTTAGAANAWRTRRVPLDVPEPGALAVDPDGTIFVGGENIVVALAQDGKELRRFPVEGRVGCMTVTPGGRLLAGLRHRVGVLDKTGSRIALWDDLGERAWLTSLAADEENVYAADAGNRVVVRFDNQGKMAGRIGAKDTARGVPGFNVPSPYFDVAINPLGELWIVNPGMHGLENYRANGDLVSSWYRPGIKPEAFCGCCNPCHIAFRPDSSIVTAEKGWERIKIYAPDTSLLEIVAAPEDGGGSALACSVESRIADLAVIGSDKILVLDRKDKAIIFYER